MKKLYFVMALLVVASMILTACGAPATQASVVTDATNAAAKTLPACVPLKGQACVVVSPKTISGGQIASTFMEAKWVVDNEVVGSPASITAKFSFRGIENRQIEVQPNGHTELPGGTFEKDVTVYEVEAEGYTCSWREGTLINDCIKQ